MGCTASAAAAIFICAISPALWLRLLAIGVASFSSGLGELSYLQLSALYAGPANRRGRAIGWFSSGTGVRVHPSGDADAFRRPDRSARGFGGFCAASASSLVLV